MCCFALLWLSTNLGGCGCNESEEDLECSVRRKPDPPTSGVGIESTGATGGQDIGSIVVVAGVVIGGSAVLINNALTPDDGNKDDSSGGGGDDEGEGWDFDPTGDGPQIINPEATIETSACPSNIPRPNPGIASVPDGTVGNPIVLVGSPNSTFEEVDAQWEATFTPAGGPEIGISDQLVPLEQSPDDQHTRTFTPQQAGAYQVRYIVSDPCGTASDALNISVT